MTIATGTVKSCRKNRKGFQLDDGNWYSRMDGTPMDQLEQWRENGTVISVEWFEKDGWKNFTADPKVVEEAKAEPDQKSSGGNGFNKPSGGNKFAGKGTPAGGYKKQWHAYEDFAYQQTINTRITRQNALNNAVALVVGIGVPADQVGPDTVDLVTTVANLFVEWVEGGTA